MPKRSILVIEDDPVLQKLNHAIFTQEGFRVITVCNGKEALTALQQFKADLIITDVLMPEMDGYQLAINIRSDKKLKHIPIIICTATYTTEIDEAIAIKAGANVFIRKPASMHDLLKAVKKLLHNLPEK